MPNVAWVAIVALCVTSSVVGCSAGASAVPPFNEQRWGQALRQIGDMVGIDWRSQRLVCPIGDCIAAHTWPSEAEGGIQRVVGLNIPWQDWAHNPLIGTTTSWYGTVLGMCDLTRDDPGSTCVLDAQLGYLAARADNFTNAWESSVSLEEWEAHYKAGEYDQPVEIAQDGEILNANGTIEYKFKDHFRASSITLVHAQPNASWYKPGAMWDLRNARCPGWGNATAADAFFDSETGLFNSLNTGFIVMTNMSMTSEFVTKYGVENSTTTSGAPTDPFVFAVVQQQLPYPSPCNETTAV